MQSKMILRSLFGTIFFAALLFLSAGTLAWPEGWAFLILFNGCSIATGFWLQASDPDLLAARMKSPFSADQRPRDRVVIVILMIVFAAWLLFMPLDAKRFGWSRLPVSAELLGAVLILVAFYGWILVLRANSFAAVTVRVQPERGQTVISSGPYAVVRHPMYGFALLFMIGTPLMLGSLWGLAWLLLHVPVLALRTLGEEKVLREGLAGYRDYAARVRFRLVPGVW
jgi:protein-S-isoprenylcysteine O-methyltransferase Ste14